MTCTPTPLLFAQREETFAHTQTHTIAVASKILVFQTPRGCVFFILKFLFCGLLSFIMQNDQGHHVDLYVPRKWFVAFFLFWLIVSYKRELSSDNLFYWHQSDVSGFNA